MSACSSRLVGATVVGVLLLAGSPAAEGQTVHRHGRIHLEIIVPVSWTVVEQRDAFELTDADKELLLYIRMPKQAQAKEVWVGKHVGAYLNDVLIDPRVRRRPVGGGEVLFFRGTGSIAGLTMQWVLGVGKLNKKWVMVFGYSEEGRLERYLNAVYGIGDSIQIKQ